MASPLALFARMRFWSLLLLAAIGLQAAAPIRAPLERLQGSAFSATTLDMALSTTRRAQTAQVAPAQPLPHAPVTMARYKPIAGVSYALANPDHVRPEARGPPPRSHPARLPDSTAPPIA